MPIKRKICKIGTGKAIFLPKSWLDYIEEEYGEEVESVAVEVDDALKIFPILKGASKREGTNEAEASCTKKRGFGLNLKVV